MGRTARAEPLPPCLMQGTLREAANGEDGKSRALALLRIMAQIKCSECGAMIDSTMKSCTKCGHPISKQETRNTGDTWTNEVEHLIQLGKDYKNNPSRRDPNHIDELIKLGDLHQQRYGKKITCIECGQSISKDAESCPNCGCPVFPEDELGEAPEEYISPKKRVKFTRHRKESRIPEEEREDLYPLRDELPSRQRSSSSSTWVKKAAVIVCVLMVIGGIGYFIQTSGLMNLVSPDSYSGDASKILGEWEMPGFVTEAESFMAYKFHDNGEMEHLAEVISYTGNDRYTSRRISLGTYEIKGNVLTVHLTSVRTVVMENDALRSETVEIPEKPTKKYTYSINGEYLTLAIGQEQYKYESI